MPDNLIVTVAQIKPWVFINNEFDWEGILCPLIKCVSKSLNFTHILNEQIWTTNLDLKMLLKNNVAYFQSRYRALL